MALYIEKKTVTGFVFSVLLLVVMASIVYWNSVAFGEASEREQHALTVMNSLDEALLLAVDAQTASRGYALTGAESFLEPYRSAVRDGNREFERLRELTRADGGQAALADKLGPLLKERLAVSQRQIDIRRTQGLAAAAQDVAQGEGKRVADAIRAIVEEMKAAERTRFEADARLAPLRARNTLSFTILECAVAFVFLGLAGMQINRREKLRYLAEQALQRAQATLERRVEERTAELRSANEALRQALDDRSQAEARVRMSEGRFNHLLESAPDAMIVVNQENRMVYVNSVAEKFFGYGREELLDQPMEMLMPERFRAIHAGHHREVFGDARPRSMGAATDMFARRKDGSEFPIEASLAPMEGEGEMLVCGAIRDISERKELEEKLRQSQKMDAIGRLAGGVAHDFNNLLTVINGYSELSMVGLDARDPLREKIGQILIAGKHAADLTQQLLAFSRKQVLQPKEVDLNQLVLDVEKMLRRLLREDIELVTALSPHEELVMADPGQLTQVLMNLAVNARDAMASGGHLLIETTHLDLDEQYAKEHADVEPGAYVQLTMSDSGTGMDEMTRSRIFEPFFTSKKSGQGTGLGLATVYGIVKQAGGSIWVYSEPGKGTTFKIYLPRIKEGTPLAQAETGTASLAGIETILVVEDQEPLRKLVKEILEGYGYRVLTAANGGEALWEAERHAGPIQMMLTDVVMLGMTGRELADRLKPVRPGMKVLYMSGYTDNVVVHRGIVDLGVAYLQKPFSPDVLGAKVREVLGPVRTAATILVVDDEAGIRGLVRQLLQGAGYAVIDAADGKQAMVLAESYSVDLMITDLVMPEQEGLETIRMLRKRQPNLKIVAMSGAMGGTFLPVANQLGAHAILAKPFSQERLLETVHRVLTA